MLNKINIDSKKKILIIYIVLTLAAVAAFWQVYQYDFVNIDDNIYVTENNRESLQVELFGRSVQNMPNYGTL